MATVARFDGSLGELVYTVGRVESWGEEYCRYNVRLHVPDTREFIRQVRGNHHIFVYGDHREPIEALAGEFGIAAVPVL
jgi:L-fucose isomerase-like protein